MAKGFTVKADVPKKKAKSVDEFNMDEAKALIKGKTVVFLNLLLRFYALAFKKR